MSVSCECCVLSGRSLCDELITRPEKSYRLWCVVVCDHLVNEEALDRIGPQRHTKTGVVFFEFIFKDLMSRYLLCTSDWTGSKSQYCGISCIAILRLAERPSAPPCPVICYSILTNIK